MISLKNPRDRTHCYKTLQNNHCEVVIVSEQNVLSTNDYLSCLPKYCHFLILMLFQTHIFFCQTQKEMLNKVWTAFFLCNNGDLH